MNAFADGRIKAYWFGSGTPTYLLEMMRKFNVIPSEIGGREAEEGFGGKAIQKTYDKKPCLRRTFKNTSEKCTLISPG